MHAIMKDKERKRRARSLEMLKQMSSWFSFDNNAMYLLGMMKHRQKMCLPTSFLSLP